MNKQENNIKMDLKEKAYEDLSWIHLVPNTLQSPWK
jgi:hypothetical protein